MKRSILFLSTIFILIVMISCGGNTNSSKSSKSGHTLKSWNNSVEIDGSAGKYIELLDTIIEVYEIQDVLTEQKMGDWGTSIRFKVINQTDDWLGDMDLIFLDENGNDLYDFESTMTCEALTRNSLLGKINDGSGFYKVKFQNFLTSTMFSSEEESAEKIKNFKENISQAKYFKVRAEMGPNPNKK